MDKQARQLGRRMLAVYRELEPRTQQMAKDVGSTCREGCSACCNIQVFISLPEAVAIVEPFFADQNALADLIRPTRSWTAPSTSRRGFRASSSRAFGLAVSTSSGLSPAVTTSLCPRLRTVPIRLRLRLMPRSGGSIRTSWTTSCWARRCGR